MNQSEIDPIWNWVVSESSSFLVLDSTFTFVDLMVTLSSSLALLLACILCSCCNFNPVTFLPLPVALLKRSRRRHRSLLGWRSPGHVYGTKWSPKGPLTKKILLKQIETDLSCPNTFRGQLIFFWVIKLTKIIIKSPDDNGGDGICALNVLLLELNSNCLLRKPNVFWGVWLLLFSLVPVCILLHKYFLTVFAKRFYDFAKCVLFVWWIECLCTLFK